MCAQGWAHQVLQIVTDFGRVLDAMSPATRLLVVQLVNPVVGVDAVRLPLGVQSYFKPYLRRVEKTHSRQPPVYLDSPIVYAALAVRCLFSLCVCCDSSDGTSPGTC